MINLYIQGQTLKIYSPVIAADSLNYLTAELYFSDEWSGASKWVHFRQGELVYDIAIENNRITADKKLNLTIGEWEVYVTGTIGDSRLTTIPVIITVYKSGLIDAPLHEMPLTVAEQVDAKADTALLLAQAVKDMADSGVFKGEDGKDGKDGKDGSGIEIGDYFNTLSELESKAPKDDKLYGVGSDPVIFYGWSDAQQSWIYVGSVQGIPGKDGAQGEPGTPGRNGVIFYPSVSDSGFLSWTNDGGLTNPQTINIMGPKGETGETGANGKGPYEYAQDGGYTGTEATFITAMTQFPYHHTRHEPGGVDPITVTADMVNADSRTQYFSATLTVDGWTGAAAPYTQTVNVGGIVAQDRPKVYLVPPETFADVEAVEEAYGLLYDVNSGNGTATFKAKEKPAVAINVSMEVNRI